MQTLVFMRLLSFLKLGGLEPVPTAVGTVTGRHSSQLNYPNLFAIFLSDVISFSI